MTETDQAIRAQIILRRAVIKASRLPWVAEDPFRILAVLQAVSADTLAAIAEDQKVAEDPKIRADMIAAFGRISRQEAIEAFVRLATSKGEAKG